MMSMQATTIQTIADTKATEDRLFELSTRLCDLLSTSKETPIMIFCPCESDVAGTDVQLSIFLESPDLRLFLTPDRRGKTWATIDRPDCRPTAMVIDLNGSLDELARALAIRAIARTREHGTI